jgi:hypothetical protein
MTVTLRYRFPTLHQTRPKVIPMTDLEPRTNRISRRTLLVSLVATLVVVIGLVAALVITLKQQPAPADSSVTAPATTTDATSAASGDTFTMKGAFDLFISSDSLPNGTECMGTGSMDDIAVGTGVYVYDGSGKLLATGNLGHGSFQSNPVGNACVFPLTVNNVPDGLETYSVEVGTHGEQPVSSTTAHSWVFLSASNS